MRTFYFFIFFCCFALVKVFPQKILFPVEELREFSTSSKKIDTHNHLVKFENQIFISQIGEQNIIEAKVSAQSTDLEIFQNGGNNYSSIYSNVRNIFGSIIQNGNNNYSFDFAHDPNRDLNINLLQEGNGHHFERHGSNSIGNDLQFKMTGESQTIIVRNFQ